MATRNTKLIGMFWEPLYHYAKRREEEGLQRQREEGCDSKRLGSMFGTKQLQLSRRRPRPNCEFETNPLLWTTLWHWGERGHDPERLEACQRMRRRRDEKTQDRDNWKPEPSPGIWISRYSHIKIVAFRDEKVHLGWACYLNLYTLAGI